jgi:trehalose 6-phosphate synthase/phosphatase
VQLGVFPMGVDAPRFAALAADPEVAAQAAAIRQEAGGRQIVLGVDRLDYTKGIPRRLHAIEQLLERDPDLVDRVRYVQVAVPSRGEVDSYQRFKRQVEEGVGRINGALGTLRSAPVHYMHRSVSTTELAALYAAADVMLVTPLRDGMNLVAKEFVATRIDEDGVLVLSEFAGAAAELHSALIVNPYDVAGVADAVGRALTMARGERRARMRALRRTVVEHDVHAWAESFLQELAALRPIEDATAAIRRAPALLAMLQDLQRTMRLRLLLDYDGTLVPLARSPDLAAPDRELLSLLARLAGTRGLQLEIVSGRDRDTLQDWLGHLPIGLWAEHGFWHRARPGEPWHPAVAMTAQWMDRVLPILERFAAATPGAMVEVKSASLAWHYRRAPRDFGARQAHELRMLLGDALSNQPLEVLEGKKVIEVRWRGVSKALVAQHAESDSAAETAIVAIGDDRTDEELFRALPASSVTIAVGRPSVAAAFCVDDHRAVRRLLHALLADEGEPRPAEAPVPSSEEKASAG